MVDICSYKLEKWVYCNGDESWKNDKSNLVFETFGKKTCKSICQTGIYERINDIIEKSDDDHNDNAWPASLSERMLQIMKKCCCKMLLQRGAAASSCLGSAWKLSVHTHTRTLYFPCVLPLPFARSKIMTANNILLSQEGNCVFILIMSQFFECFNTLYSIFILSLFHFNMKTYFTSHVVWFFKFSL